MRFKFALAFGDYIFLMRPTLFFPVWTVFLAGYLVSLANSGNEIFAFISPLDMWQNSAFESVFLLTLLCGGIFILNQIQDTVSDKVNDKLFLIANDYVSPKAAYVEAVLIIIFALVGAFFIHIIQFLLFAGLLIISGWFYSYSPFNWKDKPFLGLLTNALAGLFIFIIGWQLNNPVSWAAVQYSSAYVFAISAVYLYTTIPDRKGDQQAGKLTFSVKYGLKKTKQSALILGLFSFLIAAWNLDWIMGIPALLSLYFFYKVVHSSDKRDLSFAVKLPILLLSILVCLKIPGYALLILVTFWGAKWYYKMRFKLDYPSFSKT